jgi:hypothetical protein
LSSGHFHASHLNEADASRLYQKAIGHAAIRERIYDSKYTINRDYDIPYLAGYSVDARTIYIDRHLPNQLLIGGRRIAILPFLSIHERTEKALLDFLDYKYEKAHQIATFIEHRDLKRAGIKPSLYEKALDPYIKADQHEKITKIPRNLDLKPYRDSRDLRLLERMKDMMQ